MWVWVWGENLIPMGYPCLSLGGAEGDQVESRAIDRSWKCEIDGDSILYNGNGGWKDGAMSGTQYT